MWNDVGAFKLSVSLSPSLKKSLYLSVYLSISRGCNNCVPSHTFTRLTDE